jgi:hypothetical protein
VLGCGRSEVWTIEIKDLEGLKWIDPPELPQDPIVLDSLARTLATSPVDNLRDGKRAVKLATEARNLQGSRASPAPISPAVLSTLAAAYAETGNFQEAVKWATEAVMNANARPGISMQLNERLKLELESYKAGKPWREGPTPNVEKPKAEGPTLQGESHYVIPPAPNEKSPTVGRSLRGDSFAFPQSPKQKSPTAEERKEGAPRRVKAAD